MITRVASRRLSLMTVIGAVLLGGIGFRLVDLQINQRDELIRRAEDQQRRAVEIPAGRGLILDRHLRALALNIASDSYSVQAGDDLLETAPSDSETRRFAAQFAALTHQSPDRLFVKLTDHSSFSWLMREVDLSTSAQIQQLPLMRSMAHRVRVEREVKRVYPYGRIAGQLTGFTNIDGKGLTGIELAHNQALAGSNGFSIVQVDSHGSPYARIDDAHRPPVHGGHLVLTIDAASQHAAEQTLQETIEQHHAKGGMIIVLEPKSGEILAMASEPSFDPNHPGLSPVDAQKIRPVVDMFEPGSTFKIVAATAALDTEQFTVQDSVDCNNGILHIGNRTVTDHEAFNTLTFRGVIEHSSNVGTIRITQTLGARPFYQYARAFGFGSTTGIALPGEALGVLLTPTEWSATTLQTMAIGYGVSVTGLQLALAYGAVANGGLLMEPRIVKAVVHPDGSVEERPPFAVRRVMNPETANTLRNIFAGVVKQGTGKRADLDGYMVGGKTGTAWKAREDGPGYTRNYRSSFAGLFPADNPEIVALIVIDEPKGRGYYGGEVAAPAFRSLVKRLTDLPQGPIRTPQDEKELPRYLASLPDMTPRLPGMGPGAPAIEQPELRMLPITDNNPERTSLRSSDTAGSPSGPTVELPSVIGLSLREAFARLAREGFEVTVIGSGRVVRQIPEPGSLTVSGDRCLIEGQPANTMALAPAAASQ